MSDEKQLSRVQRRNRATIMAAALDVFSQNGFRGATLDQIANAASMSKPNLIYYFPNKEAIFLALLNQLIDRWLAPLRELDPDGDPMEEILRYVRRKLQMSREMPRESRLFANEILQGAPRLRESMTEDLKPLFDATRKTLQSWMDAKKIAPMDPAHLIFSIWATTQHYADFDAQIDLLMEADQDVFAGAEQFLITHYTKMLSVE